MSLGAIRTTESGALGHILVWGQEGQWLFPARPVNVRFVFKEATRKAAQSLK